jgi:hypothetical protein
LPRLRRDELLPADEFVDTLAAELSHVGAQGDAMDWAAITKATRAAFGQSVNDWIVASYVQGGWVRGPNAELTPGSLKSSVDLEQKMVQALAAARVPSAIAQTLARELAGAWRAWADGFRVSLPGAYPKLAAVPGPMAPPTPASSSYPIARGTSAGEVRLNSATLAPRLQSALRLQAGRDIAGIDEKAIKELATWVEASFMDWKLSAQLVGVMGKGPIPTFAPPYVPVGPVVMGDNLSAPGHVIAGPRFGRMI